MTYRAARAAYGINWAPARAAQVDESGRRAFEAMAPHLRVASGDSAFCKTLYVPLNLYYEPRLIHLPHGFGVSVLALSEQGVAPALRGKYVITGPGDASVAAAVEASGGWRTVGTFEDLRLHRSRGTCPDVRRGFPTRWQDAFRRDETETHRGRLAPACAS